MTSYSTLRERVRDVLLEAGFKAREDTVPTLSTGGTFYLKSGAGVEAGVEWWDSSAAERRVLLEQFADALRKARFVVEDRGDALYVEEPPESSSEGEA